MISKLGISILIKGGQGKERLLPITFDDLKMIAKEVET